MWCALHLPCLAIDVAERGQSVPTPFAIIIGSGTRTRVIACNSAATQAGVEPGMKLTAAQALVPLLCYRERDPSAEQQALIQLAEWAGQYSSLVSLVPPQELVLEIGRSRALFGEAEVLTDTLQRGLIELGFHARVAHAPTPLAATWLARGGRQDLQYDVAQPWQTRLHPLPLTTLAESSLPVADLHALGLRTLGDVLRLPRAALSRRIGPAFLHAVDRAFGRAPDPREAYVAPAQFHQRIELLAPAHATDTVLFALRRLFIALEGFLRARQAGVSELHIELSYEDHPMTSHRLGFQQSGRVINAWLDVAREWLARMPLPAPVTALTLAVPHWQPLAAQQQDAYAAPTASEQSALLLARLQARLGADAVHSVSCVAEHRPEYAWRQCAAQWRDHHTDPIPQPAATFASPNDTLPRPLWLLREPTPLPLIARRPWYDGELQLVCGPERIESGWWDDCDVQRDYFIAHSARGEQLWIFRTLHTPSQWFLHGFFG